MTDSSWAVADCELFGVDNLPYGSFVRGDGVPHVGVRVGQKVLDLTSAYRALDPSRAGLFAGGTLDLLLAAGRPTWTAVRSQIVSWLTDETHRPAIEPLLVGLDEVVPRLPFTVADYVDFYASECHATNVGRIFRPDGEPLTPNWKHLPIGYHGRSGTVVVSGTEVRRPVGQYRGDDGSIEFGPSGRLDLEAEVAFVLGTRSTRPVPVAGAARHIFGLCLLNDWSARDIQAWEYVPLGPFLGKSFATSVSAWITPMDALAAARVPPPPRDPAPLPYLDDGAQQWGFDIDIEVLLNGQVISRPPFATMYWTAAQMLAHLTVNGASILPGDVFASGTVSGSARGQRGSLLELTWNGTDPIALAHSTSRTFLEDGDEVVLTATAPSVGGGRISLGEVRGRIVSAES
ncbi:MAG: fumarylacetoacetase [Actinomycetota bacterium]